MIKVTLELNIEPAYYDGREIDDIVYDEILDVLRSDIMSACEVECFCKGCETTRNVAPSGFCDYGIGVK